MTSNKQAKITSPNSGAGRQCKHRSGFGTQCKAYAVKGEDYCFMHGGSVESKAARLKGGLHRSPVARVSGDVPIVIATMADVLALINVTIADVWILENSPARARCLLACASVAIEALQVGQFEERILRLEQGQHVIT